MNLPDMFEPMTSVEKAEVVVKRYAISGRLMDLTKEYGLDWSSFFLLLKKYPILANLYVHAQEMRAELLVEEGLQIVDTELDPNRARVRSDMRRWAASKYNARKFGDRLDLNITEKPSIIDALNEAKARVIDVSPVEHKALSAPAVNPFNDEP